MFSLDDAERLAETWWQDFLDHMMVSTGAIPFPPLDP